MRRLHLYVLIIAVIAVCLEGLLFFAPVPDFISDPGQFRTQLVVVSSFSIYYFAAAVLFLYGMREFKPEMRRSYLIITLSMGFFGLVNLQYPLLLYAGLIPGPWVAYGGSLLVIIPGVIMHYWGVRHVARTLGLTNRAMGVPALVMAMMILAAVAVLLPHVREIPEPWFMLHQTAAAVNLVLNIFSSFILLAIIRTVGTSYQRAFRWLNASVIISAIGFVHIIIVALFGQNNAYTQSGMTAVPFIVVSLLYAISGYYFCKVRFYGQTVGVRSAPGRGILDAVVSTASLVSNAQEVDILLDNVRKVTSDLKPGESISPQSTKELVAVYLQLEKYLLNQEKLKNFTKDGLRARLNEEALRLVNDSDSVSKKSSS